MDALEKQFAVIFHYLLSLSCPQSPDQGLEEICAAVVFEQDAKLDRSLSVFVRRAETLDLSDQQFNFVLHVHFRTGRYPIVQLASAVAADVQGSEMSE